MIRLIKYDNRMQDKVEQFELSEEQLKFVKSPQENIETAQLRKDFHPILGLNENEEAVVFFVLDNDSEFKTLFDVEPSIYVRSFSTDQKHLRQGYAKEALRLLPEFVETHYPEIEYITLIVDDINDKAREMYIKQAFTLGSKVQGSRYPGQFMNKRLKQ